jgi:hypothetical protein
MKRLATYEIPLILGGWRTYNIEEYNGKITIVSSKYIDTFPDFDNFENAKCFLEAHIKKIYQDDYIYFKTVASNVKELLNAFKLKNFLTLPTV